MKRLLTLLTVFVLSASLSCDNLYAGRGGSFSSSGGSRSSESSGRSGGGSHSSGRSSSFSSPSSHKSTPNLSGSRPSVKSDTSSSKTDRAAAATVKKDGKVFSSRADAVRDFKSQVKNDPKMQKSFSSQYPTTYGKEPVTRPSHIPQTYGGNTVIYNNGGYGYMGAGGIWMPLTALMLMNTMSDAALASSMGHHGYVTSPAVVSSDAGIVMVTFSIVVALAGLLVIGIILYNISKKGQD